MDVCRTVYSLYYPETRSIVDALWAQRPHGWYERNYTKRQDPMHLGCLDGWVRWAAAAGVRLGGGFAHHYPMSGASEGVHALLAYQATHGTGRIHVFQGEYEGYTHTATALALPVVAHSRDKSTWPAIVASLQPGDAFWLSAPSAIDGNLWPDFAPFVALLAEQAPDVRVVVDLTYVGAVPGPLPIDLDRPNVVAVIWSLSKPFGVYYHRIGGLLSRAEVPSLTGNPWFKNLFSLHLGERLMSTFAPGELPARYRACQEEAIERGQSDGAISSLARPSDVVLLAHAPAGDPAFTEFARGDTLRFCLTPAMDRHVNPGSSPRGTRSTSEAP